jgi:hypothetical protein
MVTRHVAYSPRPGYEVLGSTGLRRYPQCVRKRVTIVVPPAMRAWLPVLAQLKPLVLMPAFTVN